MCLWMLWIRFAKRNWIRGGSNINKRQTGTEYETLAVAYLEKHDVKIVERNFRNRFGEIDIIGYLAVGLSLYLICQYLMIQPNRLGALLRIFSHQKSLQVQIAECQENIITISNRLNKQKEENSYSKNDLIYADFDVDL